MGESQAEDEGVTSRRWRSRKQEMENDCGREWGRLAGAMVLMIAPCCQNENASM